MYQIEGEANGFTSIPTAMYLAIVTVTTVGYGDISPKTIAGRILASMLMIVGYGIIAVPTGIVTYEFARPSEPGHTEFALNVAVSLMTGTQSFASVVAPNSKNRVGACSLLQRVLIRR